MATTKAKAQETTELVPLESEVGSKLVEQATAAPNVVVQGATDSKAAQLAIIARILDAETVEGINAVFSKEGGWSSRDLAGEGTHVELRSMTIAPSDFPDPKTGERGWYFRFDAVDLDTGEAIRVSSSSKSVAAAFIRADNLGAVPCAGHFTLGDRTEAGYFPVHFDFDGSE